MKNLLYLHEDEKNRILNLHKKLISEQTVDPNVKALTDAAAIELTRLYPNNEFMNQTAKDINDKLAYETKEADVNNPKKVMNNNLVPYIKQLIQTKSGDKIKFDNTSTATQTGQQPNKIVTLQGILNDKFGGNLVPDGKWGPKTAAAVQKALATLQTQTAVNNPTTTTTTTIATGTATTGTATTGTATTGTATTGTAANPKQDMDDQSQEYWGKKGPIQQ